jgi:hypothetical protein
LFTAKPTAGQDNSEMTASRAAQIGLISRSSRQKGTSTKAKQKARWRRTAPGCGLRGGLQGYILFKSAMQVEQKLGGGRADFNTWCQGVWGCLSQDERQVWAARGAARRAARQPGLPVAAASSASIRGLKRNRWEAFSKTFLGHTFSDRTVSLLVFAQRGEFEAVWV